MKKKKLMRLKPKVKILNDFYVLDTETAVSYEQWVEQRLDIDKKFVVPPKSKNKNAIYWGLNARPESFRLGVIYGHNYQKEFYDLEELKQELLTERFRKKKVFIHNAEYDLTVMYGNIFLLDAEAIFNGKFICASNGNCQFADSMNIFQTSVAKLGKMLGISKPNLGNDYFSENGIDSGVINRCAEDCKIVWTALQQIFEDSGDIKITQASLSMTYFRRFHQPYDIEHNQYNKYFWASYYGGRCEVFKIGKTHAQVIDVNSMYPYAMYNCTFPNPRSISYDVRVTPTKLLKYLSTYEGCVFATVKHKKTTFGYLPVKHNGKLIFPVGTFSGCWNFHEIRYALECKAIEIIKVEKVVYGERMESPFKNYVDTLYKQRFIAKANGNEFEEYRIKIFMNSLYGKFAQRITEESIYIEDIEKQIDVIEDYTKKGLVIKLQMFNAIRKDAILYIKSTKFSDLSYSIPSFASYITSFSRVLLLKKLNALEKNKIVYCDTDSIFYEIDTPDIDTGLGLGQWKKEDKIVTEIMGLKNYRYIDKEKGTKELRRLKGVPNNAEEISDNNYVYFNLMKTKESLRRNKIAGTRTKRTKVISGKYDKRIVLTNGETLPIEL